MLDRVAHVFQARDEIGNLLNLGYFIGIGRKEMINQIPLAYLTRAQSWSFPPTTGDRVIMKSDLIP
jgi:hypothetical protein